MTRLSNRRYVSRLLHRPVEMDDREVHDVARRLAVRVETDVDAVAAVAIPRREDRHVRAAWLPDPKFGDEVVMRGQRVEGGIEERQVRRLADPTKQRRPFPGGE